MIYLFHYEDYSIPKFENDGFAIKFHDPYEIITKDAPTFYTTRSNKLVLQINPKVTRIDESLINSNIDV